MPEDKRAHELEAANLPELGDHVLIQRGDDVVRLPVEAFMPEPPPLPEKERPWLALAALAAAGAGFLTDLILLGLERR